MKQFPEVDISTDTYETLIARVNDFVYFSNDEILNVNTTGAYSEGLGHVNGHFSANVLSANYLRGGNLTSNSVLLLDTNTQYISTISIFGNSTVNTTINSTSIVFSNSSAHSSFGLANVFIGSATFTISQLDIGTTIIDTTNGIYTGTPANVNATFDVTGLTTLHGGLTVNGSTIANWDVTVGNTLASGNVTVTGFVNVSSFANIIGNTYLRSNATVNGSVLIANTLATGNTSISGFINVSSSANIVGVVNIGGTLSVNGATT